MQLAATEQGFLRLTIMHSIPELLRLVETSGDQLVHPPAQAESPRVGYQESRPVEF